MAVYTEVSTTDIEPIIKQYQPLKYAHRQAHVASTTAPASHQKLTLTPITAGMENSNYWLSWTDPTATFEGVLTVFEVLTCSEVEQCIALTQHLAGRGLAVPAPIEDQCGVWLHRIHGKPAIICPRLSGKSIQQVTTTHAHQIGQTLAKVHQLSQTLPAQMVDNRNLDWWQSTAAYIQPNLDIHQQSLMRETIQYQIKHRQQWLDLPSGWIHGDCFRDNVLFRDESVEDISQPEIGAILDWYNASRGPYLYDLAIVYLDWCVNDQGVANNQLGQALLAGYRSERCFSEDEVQAWSLVCQAASLRFWLSRLSAQQDATSNNSRLPEDRQPDAYYRRLTAAWRMPTQLPR